MRTLLLAAFFAATVGFSVADDAKDASPKDKLVAVQKSLRDAQTEWSKAYQKADAEEKQKLMPKRMEIMDEHGGKALAIARDFPKDDVAFEALIMAMSIGGAKTKKEASEFVVATFADDEKILSHLPQLGKLDTKLMATLAEKSKNKNVRGVAIYSGIEGEIEAVDYPRGAKPVPADEAATKLAAIEKKLDAVIAESGEVKLGNSTIAKSAEKQKFFLNNLVVGKTAPDVEVELLDGKKGKISDHKGKVIVLDIWATWCGPCVAMIPHERELVEKRKDKKFAFISVSADAKKETLEKFLEKEEMPWTHMWDGQRGKLCETYQVRFFPTIYILDDKGVIRYKHVRGKAMDDAVDALLKKMDGAQ